jgi:hypothetical protein
MHYHMEVWLADITKTNTLEKQIAKALRRYKDDIWDWYQIGGRWTGAHIPGYDSEADPDHQEKCSLCNGTGRRKDTFFLHTNEELDAWLKQTKGCNGCNGTGTAIKWPTAWKPQEKDIIPVTDLPDGFCCHYLVISTPPRIFSIDHYDSKEHKFLLNPDFAAGKVCDKLKELGITSGFLVTVDCHN